MKVYYKNCLMTTNDSSNYVKTLKTAWIKKEQQLNECAPRYSLPASLNLLSRPLSARRGKYRVRDL